jgi:predicted nuclease of restriction endonuclease-like RecB superfamily
VLPKDLLEVRRTGGKIFPKFASMEDVRLAETVLKIYKLGLGKKYRLIQANLRKIETARNYRKVRGFAKLIERCCTFESATELNPLEVRMFLFRRGFVTSLSERKRVLEETAKHFGVSVEEIERAMFADVEDELILKEIPEIDPKELVKRYNLSLLQTAIFNALRLTFWISTNHKNVFRRLKWLGLMYELYESNGRLLTSVTGAASILKMTRKYGTSMAKLIPEIIKAKEWWIRAEIVDDYEKRIYFLEISDKFSALFPKEDVESVEYDSSLEEEFGRRIKSLLGCEVVREPGVVKAGRYAYIPDFLIRKNGKEVYVEIAGFWTEDYVRKKLEKIKEANIPLILIVREEFALDKPKGVLDVILIKKNKIPYRDVLRKIMAFLE